MAEAKTIEMMAMCFASGAIQPVRFKISDNRIVTVDRIVSQTQDIYAGNHMDVFSITGTMDNQPVKALLKYERRTTKWYLFRLSKTRGKP